MAFKIIYITNGSFFITAICKYQSHFNNMEIKLKKYLLLFIGVLFSSFSFSATPILKFNKQGKFKIVQFTDVHYIYNDPKSDEAITTMNVVLSTENPDFIVFTGDLIFGKPAKESLETVLNQVLKYKIPFAVTFGNHDNEQGLSNDELYDIVKLNPCNIMPNYRLQPDYVLSVKTNDSKKDAALLYCLESHSYSKIKEVDSYYAWFTFGQVNWYLNKSLNYTKQNNNDPVPALAFFHIPLPEYRLVASDDESILFGTRMEKVCSPKINTGMFAAMRVSGDVMGVFVGHDHDNDFAAMHQGIMLAYGRYSGGNTVYHNLSNGARVIELNEKSRSFQTWIRLGNGEVVNPINYPKSFQKNN